jgi:superfamily II DNA or RNA helicase
VACDQDDARAYARVVEHVTGEPPVVILSDDRNASARIAEFAAGTHRMAVCVRMVSEGVDIPRAACLAWLTSYRTPLFFAQAVGRVVRSRAPHESATVFLPAVRPLIALAADMESHRNHVIAPPSGDTETLDVEQAEREPGEQRQFEALDAEAQFAHVVHGGRAVVAGQLDLDGDDAEFVGLPGLLSPEQTAALLARRDSEARRKATLAADLVRESAAEQVTPEVAAWRAAGELRREVNRLVGMIAAREGVPHAQLHARLRRAVPGPPSASASAEVLQQRRDHLMAQLSRSGVDDL